MSDLSAITAAIEASNSEIEAKFKALNARFDQIEIAEAKAGRVGLNLGQNEAEVQLDGAPVLRSAAEIKSFYAAKARESGEPNVGLADFLRGVARLKTSVEATKALSVGTNSAGGYAVPSLLQSGILQALVPASSLLRAGAAIIPIEGSVTTTFAAVNSIPTAAWRAEGGTVATSDPTFRAVVATPRSLAFMFQISRELLADGVDIESALRIAIAQAFAKELDRAGLRGSGTAPEPRGILNTSGIQAVGNGANGLALANYANIFSAAQAILSADAPMPTAAIMHPRSLIKLGGLLDTTNQPMRVPDMLKGMNLIGTSQVPITLTVGTSTDCSEIYVADFTQMGFAMRENVSIQVVDQLYAATGQVAFIGHVRADVIVKYPAAFSVVTGVR